MTGNHLMRGEKIAEFDADITGVIDYGVSINAILSDNKSQAGAKAWAALRAPSAKCPLQ
jgi:hypothetical protein